MGRKIFGANGIFPLIALILMIACSENGESTEAGKSGSVSIALRVSGNPAPFKSLARSASLRISAPDMNPMASPLALTDTSVYGTVEDVPAGPSRKFEIGIFDSSQREVYSGSAVADVKAGATNGVSVILKRSAGAVTVDGTIVEGPDSATLSQRTLWAGAQSSAQYGSSLDIDEFRTYLIVGANANAAEIDLIFAFSASASASAIYSPYAAKNGTNGGAGFDFLSGFAPANETELRQIPDVDFSKINHRTQLDSLWGKGSLVTNGRLILSNGLAFMAKSNRGKPVLMQAVSLNPGAAGNCELVGKAEF